MAPSRAFAQSSVVCSMPASCLAGISFAVTNSAVADAGVGVYAVEDQLPPGWVASSISHNGRFDAANRKVKWGPFFDHTPRPLSYRATAPAGVDGPSVFSGTGVFDADSLPIAGIRSCRVIPVSEANSVVSALPQFFQPGVAFTLGESANPAPNVTVYAVEAQLPAGWIASGISHSGGFDAAHAKVKWGPFFDHTPRLLTAQITPPADAASAVDISGTGSFDGVPVALSGQTRCEPNTSAVVSSLPDFFQPGVPFSVALDAIPRPDSSVYAVEDAVPPGWTVSAVNESGALDPDGRTVKWGPFFDGLPRLLAYQAEPPAGAAGSFLFSGRGSFDGFVVPVTGRRSSSAISSAVVRSMPPEYLPGLAFFVTNIVSPASLVEAYAMEEETPDGWAVSAISHGGSFDSAHRKVKWGPFFDHDPRELTYQITPPAFATQAGLFSGAGSFDGVSVAASGQTQSAPVPIGRANIVTRGMSSSVRSGLTVLVTNTVSVAANVSVYALEDRVPDGWVVGAVGGGGSFEPVNRKVKWGPFFDNSSRAFTYEITAPVGASGPASFEGAGSFDGVSVAIGGPSAVNALLNHPPVARPDAVEREAGQPVSLAVSQLLANDSDADGDTLAFRLLSSTSEGGVPISLSGGVVTYSVPAVPMAGDTFAYEIDDGFGGTASGLVTVTALPPQQGQNITRIVAVAGGTIHLEFAGLPLRSYLIQATEGLVAPNWITLGSATASAVGEFQFDDADAPNHLARFYRTAAP